jgi:hypothetical protein
MRDASLMIFTKRIEAAIAERSLEKSEPKRMEGGAPWSRCF